MKNIPYGKQEITSEDIKAVVEVLKSDYLTQGPSILEFEKNFAKYVDAKHAIAVSNGTTALHLCAMAMNVQPGTKVITTPITFVATSNCIEYCGGEVIFGDIDPETYTLDFNSVKKLLEESPKGTYSGIIPVDFAGKAVNLEEFRSLADEYNLWIIEDSCHSPGGYFIDSKKNKSKCGSGTYADLAIFSFHPVKHIAAGEGGMITTNDPKIYEKLLSLRSHGIIKDHNLFKNKIEIATGNVFASEYPKWYMEMQNLGYNYRITDMQATLGNSQLKRAENGIKLRQKIASNYYKAFKGLEFIKGQSGIVEGHAYHLYVLEVEDRLGLYNYLREHHIYAQIHYFPVHLMPFYKSKYEYKNIAYHAEEYYKNCISLPMYPSLSVIDQKYVINTLIAFYE
jgi:hypothetical protein